ncbi:hypothetical protein VTO42DRAFT_2823 [Malbranchea cinnamomea]
MVWPLTPRRKSVAQGLKEAVQQFKHPPEAIEPETAKPPTVLMVVGPCFIHTGSYKCPCDEGAQISNTGVFDPTLLCHSCLHPFSVHAEYVPLQRSQTHQTQASRTLGNRIDTSASAL